MDNAKFEVWLSEVDREFYMQLGLSVHDLPDWDMYSAFEAGIPPSEAVEHALDEVGLVF